MLKIQKISGIAIGDKVVVNDSAVEPSLRNLYEDDGTLDKDVSGIVTKIINGMATLDNDMFKKFAIGRLEVVSYPKINHLGFLLHRGPYCNRSPQA